MAGFYILKVHFLLLVHFFCVMYGFEERKSEYGDISQVVVTWKEMMGLDLMWLNRAEKLQESGWLKDTLEIVLTELCIECGYCRIGRNQGQSSVFHSAVGWMSCYSQKRGNEKGWS